MSRLIKTPNCTWATPAWSARCSKLAKCLQDKVLRDIDDLAKRGVLVKEQEEGEARVMLWQADRDPGWWKTVRRHRGGHTGASGESPDEGPRECE